jgi:hypothetical protein
MTLSHHPPFLFSENGFSFVHFLVKIGFLFLFSKSFYPRKVHGRRMRPLMPSNRVKPLTPHATSSPTNFIRGGTIINNKFEDMAAKEV